MLEFIKNKRNLRLAILVVTGVGVLALSYHLSAIINPLLIALIIAYILNPLVNRIESLQVKVRGYRLRTGRTGAVAIIYLMVVGLVVLFFVVVIPVVFTEIKYLSFAVPGERILSPQEVFSPKEEDRARDGVEVTEPFTDKNKNGRRDPDEPYQDANGNGLFDRGEPFDDVNRNGLCEEAEHYSDLDGNGRFDPPEDYEDRNGDGRWTDGEEFLDLDQDGAFTPSESFTDRNKNGVYDGPEPFEDRNRNGEYDAGEPYTDVNGNGSRDPGEPFEDRNSDGFWSVNEGGVYKDLNGNGRWDPPEPFEDRNDNKKYDAGEPFVDANQNGVWNAVETWKDWNDNGLWDREISRPFNILTAPEPFEDGNGNGRWDEKEPFTDYNGNNRHDPYIFFRDTNQNGIFDMGWADQAVYAVRRAVTNWNARFPKHRLDLTVDSLQGELEKYFLGSGERFQSLSNILLYGVKSGIMGMLDLFSIFILIPFYTFFFLRSMNGIRDAIRQNLPGRHRVRIWNILTDIHISVSSFFRGRLAVCFLIAALTWFTLSLFDLPFSLLMGVVAGVAIIVPLLSFVVVDIPVAILLLADGSPLWTVAVAILCLTVIQAVENFYLTPKVLGKETQLHPITIFVSLLIGGSLFGLFGVLLAVPLASIMKILSREFILPQVQAFAKEEPVDKGGGETGLFERRE
jgi:predicted PurR-regulated permease PerM